MEPQQHQSVIFRKTLKLVRRFTLALKNVRISVFLIKKKQFFSSFEKNVQELLTLHKSDHFCESDSNDRGRVFSGWVGTGPFGSDHISY